MGARKLLAAVLLAVALVMAILTSAAQAATESAQVTTTGLTNFITKPTSNNLSSMDVTIKDARNGRTIYAEQRTVGQNTMMLSSSSGSTGWKQAPVHWDDVTRRWFSEVDIRFRLKNYFGVTQYTWYTHLRWDWTSNSMVLRYTRFYGWTGGTAWGWSYLGSTGWDQYGTGYTGWNGFEQGRYHASLSVSVLGFGGNLDRDQSPWCRFYTKAAGALSYSWGY